MFGLHDCLSKGKVKQLFVNIGIRSDTTDQCKDLLWTWEFHLGSDDSAKDVHDDDGDEAESQITQ